MHRYISVFFLLAGALMMYAADNSADYKLKVENFTELVVVDGVRVEYHCNADSAGWARFSCPPELASKIQFTNNAERLTVRSAAEEVVISGLPKVTVYSHGLHKVENSGDSIVEVFMSQPADEFKALQIGNGILKIHNLDAGALDVGVTAGKGSVAVDGKAKKAKISNVSAGPVDASRLEVVNVNCVVFGSGCIDCSPSESLRVYGAGSGKVYYHSVPSKIINRGIGVKAKPHNEKND